MIDKAIPQGQHGHLDHSQEEWLRLMPDGWDGTDLLSELQHETARLRNKLGGLETSYRMLVERHREEMDSLKAENSKVHDRYTAAVADGEAWHAQWVAAHKVAGQLQDLASELFAAMERLEREHGVDGLAGPSSLFARRMYDLVGQFGRPEQQ